MRKGLPVAEMKRLSWNRVLRAAILCAGGLFAFHAAALCGETPQKWNPGHYALPMDEAFFTLVENPGAARRFERLVASLPPEIVGVQGGAFWRQLEPREGVYDFRLVEAELAICARYRKHFFCTVSDRRYNAGTPPVPDYILLNPAFHGGIEPFASCAGSVVRLWDPAVMDRFNRLVTALGARFDREPYFEGVEFVETALPVNPAAARGLTNEAYIAGLKARLVNARAAFPASVVLQETNWLAPDDRALADFARFCVRAGVGMGGPDLIPDSERAAARPRIPAYGLFQRCAGRMPLGCDVQWPEFVGRTGNREIGRLTPGGIFAMGVDTLGLNYIFWGVCDGKGLNFTFRGGVLPLLKSRQGRINTARPANLSASPAGR